MSTAVDFGALEDDHIRGIVAGSHHPQPFRSRERADPRLEFDLPGRTGIGDDRLDPRHFVDEIDLVVDSVGSTMAGSIRSLAYRGRISSVGDAGRDIQPVDIGPLKGGNQSITGVFLGAELFAGRRAYDNIARLIDLAAAGEIEVVVDRTFPLAEAAAAHQYIEDRKSFGRVVLIP